MIVSSMLRLMIMIINMLKFLRHFMFRINISISAPIVVAYAQTFVLSMFKVDSKIPALPSACLNRRCESYL